MIRLCGTIYSQNLILLLYRDCSLWSRSGYDVLLEDQWTANTAPPHDLFFSNSHLWSLPPKFGGPAASDSGKAGRVGHDRRTSRPHQPIRPRGVILSEHCRPPVYTYCVIAAFDRVFVCDRRTFCVSVHPSIITSPSCSSCFPVSAASSRCSQLRPLPMLSFSQSYLPA